MTFAMGNTGENMGADVRTISIGEAAVLVAKFVDNNDHDRSLNESIRSP